MKILSVGPGTATLLFGLAVKKMRKDAHVTIMPLPPQATTGIAFSGLKQRPIVQRIEKLIARPLPLKRWQNNSVRHKGHTIELPASQSAIASDVLDRVLENAARDAGCDVQMRTDFPIPAEYAAFDIVALAPMTDSDHLSDFLQQGPTSKVKIAGFVVDGLATDQLLELAETKYGSFFGHGFEFSDTQAMFYVEANESAWTKAGLTTDAEVTDFVYRIFANALKGTAPKLFFPLQAARASMPQRWHSDKNVLLGGTELAVHDSFLYRSELALADAFALADAIAEEGTVRPALEVYEKSRRRVSASAERTSALLLNWSEHLHRYRDFDPIQFSFSALTRSMRVNHRDIARVAPDYLKEVDRNFAGSSARETQPVPPMFVPLTLRGLTIPNRIGFSPMCMYVAQNGMPDDFHLVHIGSRAIGGAGLVFTEMTDVSPEGRCTHGCTGMYAREHVDGWRRVVDYVHRHTSSKIAIQLGHAGRRASTAKPWEGGTNRPALQDCWETVGPTANPYAETLPSPREMTVRDMDKVIADFVRATGWSVEAGFDLVELHMAHGYLFSTFLSPASNLRTDAFGGAIENRARFPLEVVRAVRAAWPADRPLSVRISAIDWSANGSTIEQMIEFSHMLKGAGVDIIDVSTGNVINVRRPPTGRLFQTPFSDQIRNEVKIPTMTVGRIASYGDIDAILAAGRADICLLAKAHLDDPYFARHAAKALGHRDMKWPEPYATAAEFTLKAEG